MDFTDSLNAVDKYVEGLPTVRELETAIKGLESAYDDITERYIEQRLKLTGLLQAARAIADQRTSGDHCFETDNLSAATNYGERPNETDRKNAEDTNFVEDPTWVEDSGDPAIETEYSRAAERTTDHRCETECITKPTTEFLGETETRLPVVYDSPYSKLPYSSRIKWRNTGGRNWVRTLYEWLELNGPRRSCEAAKAIGYNVVKVNVTLSTRKDLFRKIDIGVYDIHR